MEVWWGEYNNKCSYMVSWLPPPAHGVMLLLTLT